MKSKPSDRFKFRVSSVYGVASAKASLSIPGKPLEQLAVKIVEHKPMKSKRAKKAKGEKASGPNLQKGKCPWCGFAGLLNRDYATRCKRCDAVFDFEIATPTERAVLRAAGRLYRTWGMYPWNDKPCRIHGELLFKAIRADKAARKKGKA
jgi:hypothetical protein